MQYEIHGKSLNDSVYNYVPVLWVVTAFYIEIGNGTRRKNYEMFAQTLKQSGIPLLTVECAFGDEPFNLPNTIDVVKVRSKSMLWQKERLLNLGISWLPESCKYVAWLDCDLVFTNPNWARQTVAVLKQSPIAQVFQTCHRLPQEYSSAESVGHICESFGSITPSDPIAVLNTGKFEDHGHTGYGWAARRDILDKHGLYEYAIAGSADHYMAHAIYGDFDGVCIQRLMNNNQQLVRHFAEWGKNFYDDVQGNLGVVPGEVLHLWHGDLVNRNYGVRHKELARLNFDPFTDIVAQPGKPLELVVDDAKQSLRDWFKGYFASRQEDGVLVRV